MRFYIQIVAKNSPNLMFLLRKMKYRFGRKNVEKKTVSQHYVKKTNIYGIIKIYVYGVWFGETFVKKNLRSFDSSLFFDFSKRKLCNRKRSFREIIIEICFYTSITKRYNFQKTRARVCGGGAGVACACACDSLKLSNLSWYYK